jgi:hypothetical protein
VVMIGKGPLIWSHRLCLSKYPIHLDIFHLVTGMRSLGFEHDFPEAF